MVAQQWSELVYSGFYFEPNKVDLEAYLLHSVKQASGVVTISTQGGLVTATAVQTSKRLQHKEVLYAQKAPWTPEQAEGFVRLHGLSSTLATQVLRHG